MFAVAKDAPGNAPGNAPLDAKIPPGVVDPPEAATSQNEGEGINEFWALGNGYCANGFYTGGTDDDDYSEMTPEKCASHCLQEPPCVYFAVADQNCARYNTTALDCEVKEPADEGFALYKKKEINKFEFVAKGGCELGFYNDEPDNDAGEMTTDLCAAYCYKEPQCEFFSVKEEVDCRRYDFRAGNCTLTTGDTHGSIENHDLFKKRPLAKYEFLTQGDCTEKPYKYSNDDDDWESMTATKCAKHCHDEKPNCLFFSVEPGKSCNRYNDTSCTVQFPVDEALSLYVHKVLYDFNYIGKGHCPAGQILGGLTTNQTVPEELLDEENCAKECMQDKDCVFFAVEDGTKCNRYDWAADGCAKADGPKGYTTNPKFNLYEKKVPEPKPHAKAPGSRRFVAQPGDGGPEKTDETANSAATEGAGTTDPEGAVEITGETPEEIADKNEGAEGITWSNTPGNDANLPLKKYFPEIASVAIALAFILAAASACTKCLRKDDEDVHLETATNKSGEKLGGPVASPALVAM